MQTLHKNTNFPELDGFVYNGSSQENIEIKTIDISLSSKIDDRHQNRAKVHAPEF
jgi:hypothetical protein